MSFNFDQAEDVIDSRDIIARIDEMELEYGPEDGDSIDTIHLEKMDEDERFEYAALLDLRDAINEISSEWDDGVTLIHEFYFEAYVEELVTDCGYLSADLPGFIKIDWAETADNIRVDYSSVTLNGNDYWVREG